LLHPWCQIRLDRRSAWKPLESLVRSKQSFPICSNLHLFRCERLLIGFHHLLRQRQCRLNAFSCLQVISRKNMMISAISGFCSSRNPSTEILRPWINEMTVTMAAFVKMGFLYSVWLRYTFLLLILRELPVIVRFPSA